MLANIMDRQWIQQPNICAIKYLDGINDFIEFASRHNPRSTRIRCPCRRCNNTLRETFENVRYHLVRNGMIKTYTTWNHQGEQLDHASSSNVTRVDNVEPNVDPNKHVMDILNYAFPFPSMNTNQEGDDDVPPPMDNEAFEQYEKTIKKCQPRIIPGMRRLFGAHGHYRVDAWQNKVSNVEPVF